MRRQRSVLCLALVLGLVAVASAGSCSYGGHDFSKLTKSSGHYLGCDATPQKPDIHYCYVFNICGPVNDPKYNQCANEVACQYDWTTNQSYVTYIAGGAGTFAKGEDPSDPSKETIQMHYQGSGGCDSGATRSAIVEFVCDKEEVGKLFGGEVPNQGCKYYIRFPTKYACAGGSSDAGGWIFFGLTVGGFALYLAVGIAINHHKSQGEGGLTEWIPHYSFWVQLPGLVKDGCIFTLQLTKGLIAKCQGGSTTDYDEVE